MTIRYDDAPDFAQQTAFVLLNLVGPRCAPGLHPADFFRVAEESGIDNPLALIAGMRWLAEQYASPEIADYAQSLIEHASRVIAPVP